MVDRSNERAAAGNSAHSRWTSRKFLATLGAQVAAVAVLIWPEHEDAIVQGVQSVAALVVLVLSATGYVKAEASIDRARAERDEL